MRIRRSISRARTAGVALADRLERAVGRRVDLLTPAGVESIRVPAVRTRIKEDLVYV